MKREEGDEANDYRPIFRQANERKIDDSTKEKPNEELQGGGEKESNENIPAANITAPPPSEIPKIAAEFSKPSNNLSHSATERLEIDLDLEDDLNLGILVNEKLYVDGFKKMGPQESKFAMGDHILAVNGRNLRSAGHFLRLLQKHGPHVRVTVTRPMFTTKAHQFRLNRHGLTASTIKTNFPEDHFLIAHVSYRLGIHLGLSINSHDGIVVITRVEKDSLSYMRFEVGDIIIDVEGEQVRDKIEFRNYMMDAMDRNRYASVLLQRPYSPKSVKISKMAMGANQKDPLDPPFPHDAMLIGRKEMQKYKTLEMNPEKIGVKPILKDAPRGGQHLAFSDDKPIEFAIQSDIPDGKKLLACPTRAQLHARLKARLARKNKPLKAEREQIPFSTSDVNNNVVETAVPPSITNPQPSEIKSETKSDSFLRRAQDSWREKRSRMFGSNKKDTDSDSSSRRNRSKKKYFGLEKDQNSDRRNTNSDKSKKDASDRRRPNDDGSEKKKKDDSERERKRKNDDSGKKKKR